MKTHYLLIHCIAYPHMITLTLLKRHHTFLLSYGGFFTWFFFYPRCFAVGSKDTTTWIFGAERWANLIYYSIGGHKDIIVGCYFEKDSLDVGFYLSVLFANADYFIPCLLLRNESLLYINQTHV